MATADDVDPRERHPREQREAEGRKNPSATVIHEAIRLEGEEQLNRLPSSLFWSGLAAGLSMGLSLAGEGLLRAHLPDASWRSVIDSFGYSLGFLVVILGRQQLFTENTLNVILPLLHEKSLSMLLSVARLWAVVLVANLIGTVLFAAAAAYTDTFSADVRSAFLEVGRSAHEPDFWTTLARGIFAGWIIALLVWITPSVGMARFLMIVALSYVIALADLAHVIAGSVEVAYAAFAGEIGWGDYGFGFLVPALLGNVIGGVGFVAILNHAQVKEEVRS